MEGGDQDAWSLGGSGMMNDQQELIAVFVLLNLSDVENQSSRLVEILFFSLCLCGKKCKLLCRVFQEWLIKINVWWLPANFDDWTCEDYVLENVTEQLVVLICHQEQFVTHITSFYGLFILLVRCVIRH